MAGPLDALASLQLDSLRLDCSYTLFGNVMASVRTDRNAGSESPPPKLLNPEHETRNSHLFTGPASCPRSQMTSEACCFMATAWLDSLHCRESQMQRFSTSRYHIHIYIYIYYITLHYITLHYIILYYIYRDPKGYLNKNQKIGRSHQPLYKQSNEVGISH